MSLALVAACGDDGAVTRNDGGGSGGDGGGSGSGSDGNGNLTLRDRQRQLAMELTGEPYFMVGLGNDNDGPFDQAIPIDLHYTYLVGYGDQGGWPTWNTNGDYPRYRIETATASSVTPMFTYYQLALELETSNDSVLNDATRMHQYLADWKLLLQKIAAEDVAVAINIEPDFFGYLMLRAANGTAPTAIPAQTHHADIGECASVPETAAGVVQCIVLMARAIAPKARIGFHASMWGAYYDVLDPNANIEASGQAVGDFLNMLGAADTDFISVETLDRDAGFWETSGGTNQCSVTKGTRGPVYWDETNTTLPNFSQHVRWVTALTERTQRPALEWQTPLGVPSSTCGGTAGNWRDNRVTYFFDHVPELVDAGIAGITFGTGAAQQTTIDTDGGQFKTRATAYRAARVAL